MPREGCVVGIDDVRDPVDFRSIVLDVHQDQLEPAHPAKRFEKRAPLPDEVPLLRMPLRLCSRLLERGSRSQRRIGSLPAVQRREIVQRPADGMTPDTEDAVFPGCPPGVRPQGMIAAVRIEVRRRGGSGSRSRSASPKSWPHSRMRSSSFAPCSCRPAGEGAI